MKTSRGDEQLAQLRNLYSSKKEAIRRRLAEFRAVEPSEYFYELVYCLLTPQTSAENAGKVVEELQRLSFHSLPVDPEPILRNRSTYIRFHRTKSKNLLKLKDDFPVILKAMSEQTDPSTKREWLVKNVMGLGYKEATHFLRNVGLNGGLAILDRHILRNLKRYGAIRSVPKSISRRKYLSLEQSFLRFSERIGISLDELDLVFWSMETGMIRK
ncbi:MAG: N-glycosylase/DNA lyase [Ignavibacteriales bacterium]|nr:N-glycosylase/DNA lyase [Ignavibacteriales bacterium]